LNREELEKQLRESEMAYPSKVNRLYKSVEFTPCNNCPFKDENPPVSLLGKTENCFERCPYEIVIWILSPRQIEQYIKLRPDNKKKSDIERAESESKFIYLEKIKGTLKVAVPAFF